MAGSLTTAYGPRTSCGNIPHTILEILSAVEGKNYSKAFVQARSFRQTFAFVDEKQPKGKRRTAANE